MTGFVKGLSSNDELVTLIQLTTGNQRNQLHGRCVFWLEELGIAF